MRLSKFILTVTVTCVIGLAGAQAAQITGLLNISGTAKFDKKLAQATRVTAFSNVSVGGGSTGDFSSIPMGTSVTMASTYIFSPSTPTGLWSVGGFTFDLQSSTIVSQTSNFLSISGTGTISGGGFDNTVASWAFSSQGSGSGKTFTFSATTAGATPDSGMTAVLLGTSLLSLAVFRAKFVRR